MKRMLPLALGLALLLVDGQALGAGRPDPEFGTGGKVLLPSSLEEGSGTALLPDGRVVVAGYKGMLALLPDGAVDRGFGDGGFAPAFAPPGSAGASISIVRVDPRGRLIAVGGTGGGEVLVARYTADGRLDPSFGGGDGFTATDFGLPPPEPFDGTHGSAPESGAPEVGAGSATLDPGGRIVLAGQRRTGSELYKGWPVGTYEAFVARLTPEGEEDRSFAGDAVVQFPGFERAGAATAGPAGGVHLSLLRPSGSVLVHLLADGDPDPGFGEGGGRPLPRGTYGGRVLDAAGGLLVSGKVSGWREHRLPNGVRIKRLRPDGSLDRAFGRNGAVTLRVPRLEYGFLVEGPGDGIWVAINLKRRRESESRPAAQGGVGLAHLLPDGRIDRSFGHGGMVEVPFGRGRESTVRAAEVAAGEALLAGGWCGRGRCGRALVKVDLEAG